MENEIGQPPLFHNDSCKLMHDEFVVMKSFSSGSWDSEKINNEKIYSQTVYEWHDNTMEPFLRGRHNVSASSKWNRNVQLNLKIETNEIPCDK